MPAQASFLLPWWRLFWVLALAATINFASSHPVAVQPPATPLIAFDKLAHFAVFGLLATLILRQSWVWRWPGWRVGLAVVLASGFGVFDELYQHTTGRNAEILDWLADTAGAGVATLLYARWRAYRRLLEWPLLPPKAPGICQRRPAPVPVSTS